MQNNVDLILEILSQIRDCDHLNGFSVEVPGHDGLVVARHVERLVDDGFIDVAGQYASLGSPAREVLVKDLTSDGHAFLASLEAEDVWHKIKDALSPAEIGKLTMRQLGKIAMDLAEKSIRKKLGLD